MQAFCMHAMSHSLERMHARVQVANKDMPSKRGGGHVRSTDQGIPTEYICPITQVSLTCLQHVCPFFMHLWVAGQVKGLEGQQLGGGPDN